MADRTIGGGWSKHPEVLTHARSVLLAMLAQGEALPTRVRAQAWSRVAEAEYFLPELRPRSLQSLRNSVRLWPLPKRIIHLATRAAELGVATSREDAMILEAFLANPSVYACERMLVYLQSTADGADDWEPIRAFDEWTGDTFPSVAHAQILAAQTLVALGEKSAGVYARRALALVDELPSNLTPAERSVCVRARLCEEEFGWGSAAAERIASGSGLLEADVSPTDRAEFFRSAGQNQRALDELRNAQRSPEVASLRARLLRDLGRFREAASESLHALKGLRESAEPLEYAEGRIGLAEALAVFVPSTARQVAQAFLSQMPRDLGSQWRRLRRYDLAYSARAYKVLGDGARAVRLLQEYLDAWEWNPDRPSDLARLRRWQSELRSP